MIANSSSSSAPGLPRIASGTASLPMSCRRPPRASSRRRPRREPELVADGDRELRDAARVLLGRAVLALQAHHERADARAEERLLGGDELAPRRGRRRPGATGVRAGGRARSRRRRARRRGARARGRSTRPSCRAGAGAPGTARTPATTIADDDDQVRGPARQREGTDGAHGDEEVEAQAGGHERHRRVAAGLRQLRDDAGMGERGDAGDRDAGEEDRDRDGGQEHARRCA